MNLKKNGFEKKSSACRQTMLFNFFKMRITSSELHFPLNSKWAVKAVLCCEFSVEHLATTIIDQC